VTLTQRDDAAVLSRNVFSANGANYTNVDNDHRMSLSFQRTSLCNHVGAIVGSCPKKQMSGITARWIVTAMKYAQAFWDRTVRERPCDLMGGSDTCFPVTVVSSWSEPNPTPLGRFIYSLPKALNRAQPISRMVAVLRAVAISVSCPTLKRISANFANACYFGSSQGVNLRYRFANWLGSLDVNASREPFCILAQA
jgi:hypothetical protein